MELVEAILLFLPVKTLLVDAQRICHQWRSVITASLPLQQALFFKPILPTTVMLVYEKPRPDCQPVWTDSRDRKNFYTVYENPLLNKLRQEHCKVQNSWTFYSETGTWRRMLACQPPITVVPVPENSQQSIIGCRRPTQEGRRVAMRVWPTVPEGGRFGGKPEFLTLGVIVGCTQRDDPHRVLSWEVLGEESWARVDVASDVRLRRVQNGHSEGSAKTAI